MSQENNDFAERAAKHNSKKKISSWGWVILIIMCFLVFGIIKEAIHFAGSKKNGWSPEHTKDVYNSLKEGLHNWAMDSSSKKNLINCVIVKLKNKYPQGLSEVNDDSLKSTTAKYFAVCGMEDNVNWGWSPTVDSIFRIKLMETTLLKDLPKEYKKPFCTCYINRIKELYPHGLTESLRQSTKDSIATYCTQKVIK